MERIKFGKYYYEITKSKGFALVCSNCPPEEIDKVEEAVRLNDPAGTSSNWCIKKKGKLAPVKCKADKGWHYIFSC